VVALITGRFLIRDSQESHTQQLHLVEGKFKFLQIFTAGYVAFAHGANDVANGIGPLAGIWTIYHDGLVGLKSQVPIWILILGGVGIVLGLAVFGKRVIETVGTKITAITPSRGFAAEFGAATIVLVFSKLGMPVSTTHTLVGAVIGVGFARGIGAIDLQVVARIFTSWIVTIPASAAVTIGFYYVILYIFV
ncbi:inorganic phosphate transporter, partial [Calditrichota bacterium]